MTVDDFMQDWDVRRAARSAPETRLVVRGEREDYDVAAVHWSEGVLVLDLGRPVAGAPKEAP